MTDLTTDERIAQLELDGWRLVHEVPERTEPVPDAPGYLRVVEGSFRMERAWRGSTHQEVGTSLEEVLLRTEREQERIASLDDRKPSIATGPLAH